MDVAAIEGVDLLAGGYPSEFGDRVSGVFNIRSINPTVEYTELSVGLSATHARALAKGSFSRGRGSWVVSARRGVLYQVLDATGEQDQLRPSFYDLLGKVNYSLSGGHLLSGGFLAAHDNLDYEGTASADDDNHGDTLYSSYGNANAWLTMYSTFGSHLTGRNIVSAGRVTRNREGQMFDAPHGVVEMAVDDHRKFWLAGLKSDWEYELRSNLLLKAGMEARRFDYRLSYAISKVKDDVKSLYFYQEDVLVNYKRWIPFPYDQLHTMYLDLIYRVADNWQVNIAWQYRTGWPVTDVTIETEVNGERTAPFLQAGDPWDDQLKPYNRIDLRLTRKFTTSKGLLTAYVEVINLLNHKNVRNYEYSMASVPGGYTLVQDSENWFGIMPSFGLIYDFHM